MNKKLKNIKILIWDVDGTLYQSSSYYQAIAREEVNLLAKTKGISIHEASQLLKEKKKIYKSATRTLVELGCGDIKEVGKAIEAKDKEKHFQKDPKLLAVFKKLFQFRHLVLRNGTYKGTLETLKVLGFGKFWPFERVFGVVDDFETVKPDPIIFEKLLAYTKLPADQHLMIGDRVEVDLVPAKKIGMKTCLAWSKSDDPNVDFILPTVYDITKIV
ncbi:HAD family hydrolase [Candidatus Microgenomates bacterium]|nr:HAD family hydrolase [Candidatus Microgenomates bacterium]